MLKNTEMAIKKTTPVIHTNYLCLVTSNWGDNLWVPLEPNPQKSLWDVTE